MNAFTVDLEDWYHGIELPFKDWRKYEDRLRIGVDPLLKLLEDNNTKATFFTLGWVGEKYPALMKEICSLGHEMASHGYAHEKVYKLSPKVFREDIKKTKGILEDVSGQSVIAYRAPYFSITNKSLWALDILKEEGYKIDCSISPIKTWRYGISTVPDEIFIIKENGLIEFPASRFRVLRKDFAIGGAYFRIFPYSLTKKGMVKRAENNLNNMFYIHPWEYDPDHPKIKLALKPGITHYSKLKKTLPNTNKLLKEFKFSTVSQLIDETKEKGTLKEYSIRFSEIDLKKEKQFLLKEIKKVFEEVGAHNSKKFNEVYWNWGYLEVPYFESKIFTIWDEDKIIGYYHFTFHKGYLNGQEKVLASMQDMAVSPSYRGQGLFIKISQHAHKEVYKLGAALIYGFPNKRSMGGFLKYNDFTAISGVPVLVRPVNTEKVIKARYNLYGLAKLGGWLVDVFVKIYSKKITIQDAEIVNYESIDDEIVKLYSAYQQPFKNYIKRDKLWLEWRYLTSLRGKHHFFGVKENKELSAFVVVKEDFLYGNKTLVIIDFAHIPGNEKALLFLLDSLRLNRSLVNYEFDFILFSGLTPMIPKLKTIGFINVPSKINPRTLTMMAKKAGTSELGDLKHGKEWLVTLGDWDVI